MSRSAPKRRATCSTPSRASSTGSDSCRWPRPGPGCLTSDPAVSADLLGAALRLWRGRALADVADGLTALAGRIAGLEEARRTALYLRIDADLAAGRHHKLAGELAELTAAHPLCERFRAQQMLVLYRCDRRAEALAAFQTARAQLAEELGVDPGPDLAWLHEAILRADPGLEAAVAAS